MSISQVLVILLRRGWIVVLALLTTVIVAGSVLLFVPGRYDAVEMESSVIMLLFGPERRDLI